MELTEVEGKLGGKASSSLGSIELKVVGFEGPKLSFQITLPIQGNDTAFQALWRATRNKSLDGLAIRALGQAAALGHEQSLAILIEPERHMLLRTSTISALKPAAEVGNQRAIDALAAVTADPKSRGLWYMVASGLEKATIAGNATAIDAMAVIAQSGSDQMRKVALLALENASFQNHPRAAEALRSVGYQ